MTERDRPPVLLVTPLDYVLQRNSVEQNHAERYAARGFPVTVLYKVMNQSPGALRMLTDSLTCRFELPELPPMESEDLMRLMQRDKKARESGLVWVLPTRIGAAEPVSGVDDAEVRRELEAFLRDPLGHP